MGLDSLLCKAVVDKIHQAGLLGKGAGHVVLKVMQREGGDPSTAGRLIVQGYDLTGLFEPEGGTE